MGNSTETITPQSTLDIAITPDGTEYIPSQTQVIVGSVVGSIMNAVFIILMNSVYTIVAKKLNDWENHRTKTEYNDNLALKVFLFQFINSYLSFYYIAFVKRGTLLWGSTDFEDRCEPPSFLGDFDEGALTVGCMTELSVQLAIILVVQMTVMQGKEIFLPIVMKRIKTWLATRNGEVDPNSENERNKLPPYEEQSFYVPYEGTFEEYNEMIIQFGYITLFASAFPLAPILALINNIVEIRTDAYRLLTSTQRAESNGAEDIGVWYGILQFLGIISVITNCLLIGFSSTVILDVVEVDDNKYRTYLNVFIVVVALEHFLILTKYLISFFTPDVPGKVRKEIAKQQIMMEETIHQLEEQMDDMERHSGSDEDSDNFDPYEH